MAQSTNVTPLQDAGSIIESVITKGDLSKLTPTERVSYYRNVCQSVGLNPLTRPLEYLVLNGKMVLYARRDAADQLRKLNGISIEVVSRKVEDGLCVVHVRARDKTGRSDEDFGTVSIANLRGEQLANAQLKAITKAKRRVTLSIAGLGFLDEGELPDDDTPPPHIDTTDELDKFAAIGSDGEAATATDAVAAMVTDARDAADRGTQAFRLHWKGLSAAEREQLRPHLGTFEGAAKAADEDSDPFGLPPLPEPAAPLPRSPIWQEESYRVEPKKLLTGEADWQQWLFDVGFLVTEATLSELDGFLVTEASLSELDKLEADNKELFAMCRRADGSGYRTLTQLIADRRKELTAAGE